MIVGAVKSLGLNPLSKKDLNEAIESLMDIVIDVDYLIDQADQNYELLSKELKKHHNEDYGPKPLEMIKNASPGKLSFLAHLVFKPKQEFSENYMDE
jgi:hypothetical protein